MNYLLFDTHRESLYPLTLTRPVGEMRIGTLTLRQKWEAYLGEHCSYLTQPYLQQKYPAIVAEDNLLINANIVANSQLANQIRILPSQTALFVGTTLLAVRLVDEDMHNFPMIDWTTIHKRNTDLPFLEIQHPEQLFVHNHDALLADFDLLTQGRESQALSPTNQHIGHHPVFLDEDASAELAIFDTRQGPIYLGPHASVQPGAILIGPISVGEGSQIKAAAKIHPDTTIGPHCRIGGELNNCVIFGYTNKAHDGFLGNAVLGEWCNLGADTNNSNLKNDYTPVRIWDYSTERFRHTGLQFCGTIMGDHSKTGINTMLNTGTVIGVSANVFGAGFPRQFIPSFAWGGAHGYQIYRLDKAIATAKLVMARRNVPFTEADREIMHKAFEMTEKFRAFS